MDVSTVHGLAEHIHVTVYDVPGGWQSTITGLDLWTDIFCIKNHFYALKTDSLACNALHSCMMRYNKPKTQPSPCMDSKQVTNKVT